jgi:hypothetical protein
MLHPLEAAPPASVHVRRTLGPQLCQGLQIYSNFAYLAAGCLGIGLFGADGAPLVGPPGLAPLKRGAACLTGVLLVLTGLVSTWYHKVWADRECTHARRNTCLYADMTCAIGTAVVGMVVLFPLAVEGMARSGTRRTGPAALLVTAALLGAVALGLQVRTAGEHDRHLKPCRHDLQHGMWHVLGGASAGLLYVSAWLAQRRRHCTHCGESPRFR